MITLYNTTSESHVVNKTLNQVKDYGSYSFKEESSMINPIIKLNTQTLSGVSTCNYMYISDFSRYYFITDIIVSHQNYVEIHGHVDVLYTYQSAIKNMKAVVIRNENNYNTYLTDNVPSFADQVVATKAFTGGFDHSDASFIVITAGGGN